MADQNHDPPLDRFARLRAAMIADIRGHVASLRQSGVEFYGYAVFPPDYQTAFDPTRLAVAFNSESDIDAQNRNETYYRYSVDEWQNFVHDGFDAVNRELKALLPATRELVDEAFVDSVYQAVLDAMLSLRNEKAFDGVPYLVIWLSDSGNGILNRSAEVLNSASVYAEFASEFAE